MSKRRRPVSTANLSVAMVCSDLSHREHFVRALDKLGYPSVPVTPLQECDSVAFEALKSKSQVTAVVIQPEGYSPEAVASFLEHVRKEHPYIVFVVYPRSEPDYMVWRELLQDEWRTRITHYYTIYGRGAYVTDSTFLTAVRMAVEKMADYLTRSLLDVAFVPKVAQWKVFVSSTAYDLRDLRAALYDRLLEWKAFYPLMHERGTIPVNSTNHSYQDCLDAARTCDIFLLVISGRFGGEYKNEGISITHREYREVRSCQPRKPVFTFVNNDVLTAKELLKPYLKSGLPFHPSKVVQDQRVFEFIDEVRGEEEGNWLFTYTDVGDIARALEEQFRHHGYM